MARLKILSLISHPLPTLFLLIYCREKAEILKDYPEIFYQFYRSNRLRGLGVEESVRRAVAGYGCYKGWKAEKVGKVSILNYLI